MVKHVQKLSDKLCQGILGFSWAGQYFIQTLEESITSMFFVLHNEESLLKIMFVLQYKHATADIYPIFNPL